MENQISNIKNQKYRAKVKNIFFLICIFAIYFLIFNIPPSAGAQTTSQIFTAIPPRLEVQVKPGEFVRKTIQFRNEGEETAYLAVTPKDFIVKGTGGQPEFVTQSVSGRWSASSWIKLNPTTLAVPPKATVNVTLSFNVPLDALPGGHYAGILYQSSGTPMRLGTGTGAGTGVTQVVGTLVYLTVAGPVTEQALVKQFTAPSFLEYGPVEFTSEILNRSDLHVAPKGQITIRDMFGKTQTILPLEERNIFPGASLIYKNTWAEKNLFGRFRADLSAAYGSQGQALVATLFFWVLPWKVITLTLLTIIILVLLIILLRRQIKKRQEELEEKLLEEEEEIEELKEKLKRKSA